MSDWFETWRRGTIQGWVYDRTRDDEIAGAVGKLEDALESLRAAPAEYGLDAAKVLNFVRSRYITRSFPPLKEEDLRIEHFEAPRRYTAFVTHLPTKIREEYESRVSKGDAEDKARGLLHARLVRIARGEEDAP